MKSVYCFMFAAAVILAMTSADLLVCSVLNRKFAAKPLTRTVVFLFSLSISFLFMRSYLSEPQPILDVFMPLYYLQFLAVPFIMYKKHKMNFIYLNFLIVTVQSCVAQIASVALRPPGANHDYFIISAELIIQIALFALSLLVYKKFIWKNIHIHIRKISGLVYTLILLFFLISEGYLSFLFYSPVEADVKVNFLQTTVPLLIIALMFIIVILLLKDIAKKNYQDRALLLEKQLTAQLEHYENLKQLNDDFRSFKHDYKNNMHCIHTLIADGDIPGVLDYMRKLTPEFIIESGAFDTGNRVADAILTAKFMSARNSAITLNADCAISNSIEAVDLCMILSNALDNAIEACRKIENNRFIKIKAAVRQGYQYLEITNSCAAFQSSSGKFATSKADKLNHGFGLYNIKKAVQKYSGTVSVEHENYRFSLIITLKLE